MNSKQFLLDIKKHAKKNLHTIILPESTDQRIIDATKIIVKEKLAKIILIGSEQKIKLKPNKFLEIISPSEYKNIKKFEMQYYKLRKSKGVTPELAKQTIAKHNYFASMLLYNKKADGIVSGADNPTSETFRPALQIIKTKRGIKTASSFFFMALKNRVIIFADCAFNIQPDIKQLSEIAISTNDTAKEFGFKPKIAMLSFSSHGSGKHNDALKVIKATKLVRKKRKDISIDGELQFDAAFIPAIGKKKAPKSKVAGYANVFIFPDLDSGNIGYKIAERIGGAIAIGPISQGFKMPVNDLSRGCSVDDIVKIVMITSIQAAMNKK